MTSIEAKRWTEQRGRKVVRERSMALCEGQAVGACIGVPLSWSHRVPRGQGGTWSGSNGLDLCGSGTTGCHGWVESHPAAATALGWRVQSWRNPLMVPVFIRNVHSVARTWWHLVGDEIVLCELDGVSFADASMCTGADLTGRDRADGGWE